MAQDEEPSHESAPVPRVSFVAGRNMPLRPALVAAVFGLQRGRQAPALSLPLRFAESVGPIAICRCWAIPAAHSRV
jgi:hypothetical protein